MLIFRDECIRYVDHGIQFLHNLIKFLKLCRSLTNKMDEQLLESNSPFAPDNAWLEDHPASFLSAYFQRRTVGFGEGTCWLNMEVSSRTSSNKSPPGKLWKNTGRDLPNILFRGLASSAPSCKMIGKFFRKSISNQKKNSMNFPFAKKMRWSGETIFRKHAS